MSREILQSVYGRQYGLDVNGDPIWNRNDNVQFSFAVDPHTGVPSAITTLNPGDDEVTQTFQFGGNASSDVTPEMLGAKGDGVTDDSAALTLAFNGTYQRVKLTPGKKYVAGNVKVANGVTIEGSGGRDYTSINPYMLPKFVRKAGCLSVFDLNNQINSNYGRAVTMVGVIIDGVDHTCNGISGGSVRLNLERCYITNCTYGIGGTTPGGGSTYTRVAQLMGVIITNCSLAGARDFIDSEISACEFAANGINYKGTSGANSNRFLGGRYEWASTGENIRLDGIGGAAVSDYNFTGCQFDRGATCGVYLANANDIQLTGCMHRRAGASNTGALGQRSHIYAETCSDITITNPRAKHGTDDGGTGNDTPQYFIECNNVVTNLVVAGGSISNGFTTAAFHYNSGLDTAQMPGHKITGVGGVEDFDNVSYMNKASGRVGYAISPSGTIPCLAASSVMNAGASQTFTVGPLPPITTFDERRYMLHVLTRDATVPSARKMAQFPLVTRQESSGTTVFESDPATSQTTTGAIDFSTAATVISLALSTASFASDGSSFQFTATNASTSHQNRVWVQLTQ